MTNKVSIEIEYGWVHFWPAEPVFDLSKRVVGWSTRVTDSDGRDEVLPSPVRITYND